MKTYFIVSDLHARYHLFKQALKKACFDIENDDHILIIAGDVLDRGTQGHELITYLEQLIEKHRLLGVLGNHDSFYNDLVSKTYTYGNVLWNIQKNGFAKTLQLGTKFSVGEANITSRMINQIAENLLSKYPRFSAWMMNLPLYLEFKHHVIVHGFLDFEIDDWRNTEKKTAIWKRGYKENIPKNFTKHIIFGHTPNAHINQRDDIIYEGKKIMIDGGAAMGHQINVLVKTEEVL